MYTRQAGMKLVDSRRQGAEAELFVVEGDSAARSVVNLRDERLQAVLPLQGKPLNAWKASRAKVLASPLYAQLAAALGLPDAVTCAPSHVAALRYARVMLLFDPDADGIHICALMLLYFKRWLPDLLDAGVVHIVRAPMFSITSTESTAPLHAYSRAHAQAITQTLKEQGHGNIQMHAFLGLGSISLPVLAKRCVDPTTRTSRVAGEEDVAAVLLAFAALGGKA